MNRDYMRRAAYTPIGLKRITPKPFCLCGCGRRVKTWRKTNRWYDLKCRPVAIHAAMAGRKKWAFVQRRNKFGAIIQNLPKAVTREDLLAVLQKAYLRGYSAGISSKIRRQRAAVTSIDRRQQAIRDVA